MVEDLEQAEVVLNQEVCQQEQQVEILGGEHMVDL
jgi:hypothetical protein